MAITCKRGRQNVTLNSATIRFSSWQTGRTECIITALTIIYNECTEKFDSHIFCPLMTKLLYTWYVNFKYIPCVTIQGIYYKVRNWDYTADGTYSVNLKPIQCVYKRHSMYFLQLVNTSEITFISNKHSIYFQRIGYLSYIKPFNRSEGKNP